MLTVSLPIMCAVQVALGARLRLPSSTVSEVVLIDTLHVCLAMHRRLEAVTGLLRSLA